MYFDTGLFLFLFQDFFPIFIDFQSDIIVQINFLGVLQRPFKLNSVFQKCLDNFILFSSLSFFLDNSEKGSLAYSLTFVYKSLLLKNKTYMTQIFQSIANLGQDKAS